MQSSRLRITNLRKCIRTTFLCTVGLLSGTGLLGIADAQVRTSSIDSLYQKVKSAVYRVSTTTNDGPVTGSAVAIDARHLVTNCHVLEGAVTIALTSPANSELTVESMGRIGALDLCVIRATQTLVGVAAMGSKSSPKVGERGYSCWQSARA